jgi:hypothetical protein
MYGLTDADDAPLAPDAPLTPWLQTIHSEISARRFDLVNPTAAMVSFRAMALVLARVARFGGHTEDGVYSVAQHSVEGARALQRAGHAEAAVAFLLHDGHEYITGDMPTPIKEALQTHAVLASGNVYAGECIDRAIKSLKGTLDRVIHEAAGLEWPLTKATRELVKEYDARMCNTERLTRLASQPVPWGEPIGNLPVVPGCDLSPWTTDTARLMFWNACREMLPAMQGKW